MGCTVQWVKNAVLTKANLYRLLLVIGLYIYCLVGAVSFHAIEGPFEKNTDTAQIEGYKKLLGTYTNGTATIPSVSWFMELIFNMTSNNSIQSPTQSVEPKWDFYGSFYFSTTVVTTIGFGNVAPKTQLGRIFCIFYALFGIPLCLITLNKLSELFAAFRSLLLKRTSSKLMKTAIIFALTSFWITILIIIPAACFTHTEKWDMNIGLYFCFVTLSTIGFGDYVASGQKYPPNSSLRTGYRFMFFIWALMGLAYISNLISAIQNDMSETFDIIGKKLCCKKEDQKKSPIEHIDIKKEDGHESIIPPMLVK